MIVTVQLSSYSTARVWSGDLPDAEYPSAEVLNERSTSRRVLKAVRVAPPWKRSSRPEGERCMVFLAQGSIRPGRVGLQSECVCQTERAE
jgi:hypothetical protein